jgi:hypothetical protein
MIPAGGVDMGMGLLAGEKEGSNGDVNMILIGCGRIISKKLLERARITFMPFNEWEYRRAWPGSVRIISLIKDRSK